MPQEPSALDGPDPGLEAAPAPPAAAPPADASLRSRLGEAARRAVAAYTYDAMEQAFDRALTAAWQACPASSGAH